MEPNKIIEGITNYQDENQKWSLFYIENISDDFKKIVRKSLINICEGSDPIDNSYNNTVKEFIDRCDTSKRNEERKKGMIGELLVHLIMGEFYDYSPASVLFNLEEKSFKKGYDLLMYSPTDKTLWITEVKSGEVPEKSEANEKMAVLIKRARDDLKERLNNSHKKGELWRNAYNHAKQAIDSPNERKAVLELIKRENNKDRANSSDNNVLLASVLFFDLKDSTDSDLIKKSIKDEDEKLFNEIKLISIQENTYDEMLAFLRSEIR